MDDAEIIRRQVASREAMKAREHDEFLAWYQQKCDTEYWKFGQCCAGCDHWRSDAGWTGQCAAAGIVSGLDVIKSMGATFSSFIPPPGLPYSRGDQYCGKFKDDFDWTSLDIAYLRRIGAIRDGKMRPKPVHHNAKAPALMIRRGLDDRIGG